VIKGHRLGGFLNLAVTLLGTLILGGCASVSYTDRYYLSYTTDTPPPKPKNAPVVILPAKPDVPYRTIGRLAFESAHSWPFFVRSIEYNARRNGADAAILRDRKTRQELQLVNVPPSLEYVPVTNYVYVQNKDNSVSVYPVINYIPVYQPGYVFENVVDITAIEAEMIVFEPKRRP